MHKPVDDADICFQKPQTHFGGAPPAEALPQAWERDQTDAGGEDKKGGGMGEEAMQNAWEATGISKVGAPLSLSLSYLFPQVMVDRCTGTGHLQ